MGAQGPGIGCMIHMFCQGVRLTKVKISANISESDIPKYDVPENDIRDYKK